MATKIKATNRFFAPEITKIYFLPMIASASLAPTRAELTAAKDLSDEIADISGWQVTSGTIPVPDLGTRFNGEIGGRTSTSANSITFHASRDGDDVRKLLPRDTVGFIWIADGGDVPTQVADVFPVTVLSVGKVRTVADKNFQLTIQFSIPRKPVEDIVIPAAA